MKMKSKGLPLLIIMLGVSISCCLLYENFQHLDTRINSDFAAQLVLANIIKGTHQILPAEWNFSTEIHISFATLFSVMLLHFIDDWTICYIISNVFTYTILSVCVFRVCRFLDIKYWKSVLIIIGILAPVSERIIYYFHIGNEYMTYAIYELVFVLLWLKIKDERKIDIVFSMYAVWALFLGMMGFRYVMTCFAPVVLLEVYSICKADNIRTVNVPALSGVCFGGIGFLFNKYFLLNRYAVKSHANRYFKDISDIPERAVRSLKSIISLFGYVNNGKLLSWQGIINILAVLFFILSICALVHCVIHSERLSRRMRDYTYFVLFGVIVDASVIIFTCEDENPLNDIAGKYFILSIILFGPLIAQYISDQKIHISIMITTALCVYIALASSYAVTRNISDAKKNASIDCINFVRKEQTLYGYATFWQGNINQFYSDGEIVISPTGNFETFDLQKHISSSKQYEVVQEQEKYFIWLTSEENENWKERIQNVVKSYSNDSYVIYICERRDRDGQSADYHSGKK